MSSVFNVSENILFLDTRDRENFASKAVSSFRQRLAKDHKLHKQFKKILSKPMKQKLTKSNEECRAIYRTWPRPAKDLLTSVETSEFCAATVEKFSVPNNYAVGGNLADLLYGKFRMDDLPNFIEQDGPVDRATALRIAIRLARHILRPFNQYVPIGNIDAYIEEWNEEISTLTKGGD